MTPSQKVPLYSTLLQQKQSWPEHLTLIIHMISARFRLMESQNLEPLKQSFLATLEGQGKSFNTIKNYRTDLNIFKLFLTQKGSDFTLNELNELQVKEYDRFLNKKYHSPNSIRRRVQALRIFFDFLIKEGLFEENPIKKILVKPKIVDLPRPSHFDHITMVYQSLQEKLLEGSEHKQLLTARNILLFHLIYGGGLKVSDLENLHQSHINQHKGEYRIVIVPEKRDPYTILMPHNFNHFYTLYLDKLEKAKQRDHIDFDQILFNANPFKILKGGLSSRGIEIIFKEISKNFHITMTAKSLRQAGIFNWLIKEVSESRIKEWMGVQPQYTLTPYKDLLKQYPERYPYRDLSDAN